MVVPIKPLRRVLDRFVVFTCRFPALGWVTPRARPERVRQERPSSALGGITRRGMPRGGLAVGTQRSVTAPGPILLLAAALLAGSADELRSQTGGPVVGGCPVFPSDNIWNTRIDHLPVDPRSRQYVASIGADKSLKADFGSGTHEGAPIGIPFVVVPMNQPMVTIHFQPFGDEAAVHEESDRGPFPIPRNAPIEGGPNSKEDRHVVVVQQGSCTLFELYKAVPYSDGSWGAVSAARFDLEGNELRTDGWTSADAAGLPIFPGLVRHEEVQAGEIRHALRFTAPRTRRAYVWPARHFASRDTDPSLPPLGQRFRLRADFDVSGFSPANQIILRALKAYGMMLADNGSPWFLSGAPSAGWNDHELRQLLGIRGTDFEAVDVSALRLAPDSAQARPR